MGSIDRRLRSVEICEQSEFQETTRGLEQAIGC